MKVAVLVLTMVILFHIPTGTSATLADLILDLRARAGESSDTTRSVLTNTIAASFIDQGQDKIVKMGGYLPKQVDLYYLEQDSLGRALPVDYRILDRCMVRLSSVWYTMKENPGFQTDTTGASFFIAWKNPDSAFIYFDNIEYDSTLVRLFYRGAAADMDSLTDTCEVAQDRHVYIIEEAFKFYLQSQRLFQEAELVGQSLRQDMGIIQQSEEP